MFRTARPVTATSPLQPTPTSCPRCGTPISGIEATEPGRHEFSDCGHRASPIRLSRLRTR